MTRKYKSSTEHLPSMIQNFHFFGGGAERTAQQTGGGDLSEDELAARKMEADMTGHAHNLLNQSLAKGYRNGTNQGSPQKEPTTAERGSGDLEKVWVELSFASV